MFREGRGDLSRFAILGAVISVLAAAPGLALDALEPLAHFGHQTWQTENGLPQNSVHAIAQTADGYLWLGTEDGLVRFNGYSFTVFDSHNTTALRSNDIRYLLASSDHSLWVATGAGLVRIQGSKFTHFGMREGLPSDNVWSLYESRWSGIWCVTADGLAHLNGNRFTAYPVPNGIESLTGAIAEGENNSLWIGTHSGVRVFRNGRFARVPVQATLADFAPAAILVDRGGHLWVGTESGLITLSELGTRAYSEKNGLPSRIITALYQDRGGSIWVGTDSGLARITNGQVQRFPAVSTLAGSTILSVTEDREGDLWVGTDSGLTVLREQSFVTFDTRDGLPGEFVRAVLEGRDGTVWIATDHGLSHRQHGLFSNLSTKNGLASDITLSLAQDHDGNILVGTAAGLNTFHGRAVSVLTSANGLPDDFVRSIYVDRDHSTWVSTRRGLSHVSGDAISTYTESDGLGSDFVGVVLRDRSGVLWVATLHGLSRLENGRFRNYTTADGLSSNVVIALYQDGEGTLWAGTQDGGLNRIRGAFIHAFASSLGLPQAIYGIAEDGSGNLWLASNTGVYRANKAALNRVASGETSPVNVAAFGTSDGLRISECSAGGHPSIWKAHDGALWFATLKGAAVLNPGRIAENQTPPPVVLESVSIDDQSFNPASISKIKPGHSRFAFEYAGLSFLSPTRVRYRYRLDGFDKHWINAGTRRIAYYTNLGPGRYRFQVTAENGDGVWNAAGASLPFVLQPHFYQTYWFYVALAALIAPLGYAVYRWRVREVEARFAAVLGERNRIAREIHDTLAQGFIAVSVQLEVVARLLNSAPQAAQEHLDQTRSLVRSSIAEARRAIWELRSQSAEHDDFAARISKIANRAAMPGSVQVEFEVKGAYRPVMPAVEDEFAKICQEAVTNAVRHAHAERVSIELAFEKKRLRMTVTDNGCGFDVEPDASGPNGHFGLQGMRERAQRIDAKLLVDSETGKGTRVSIETMVN